MKYSVQINGKQYEVTVEKIEDDFRALTKDEASNGRDVTSEQVRPVVASTPTKPVVAEPVVAKPVETTPAPVSNVSAGSNTVTSPMPGSVIDVKVQVGQKVNRGETVVIIEAMKMETEIVSDFDGVVESINVKKGDTIDTDAVLVVLK